MTTIKTDFGTITARALREHLETLGIHGPAQDALVKDTAPMRHECRVGVVLAAVRKAADGSEAIAWLLLVLESLGIGGRDGVEGWASERMPWASVLGKGRKQATDGGAWDAAIAAALAQVASGLRDIVVYPIDTDVVVGCNDTTGRECSVHFTDLDMEDHGAMRWARTFARRGLRQVVGLPQGLPAAMRVDGTPKQWATLVNHIEQRLADAANDGRII